MEKNPELGVSPVVLLQDVLVVASQQTSRPAHNQGKETSALIQKLVLQILPKSKHLAFNFEIYGIQHVNVFDSVLVMFLDLGCDGLVKLWTIKTNECIATYDKHDGKVW